MRTIPPALQAKLNIGVTTLCRCWRITRRDGVEFFDIAPRVPVKTAITTFALADANTALQRLRDGELNGAAVIVPTPAYMPFLLVPPMRGRRVIEVPSIEVDARRRKGGAKGAIEELGPARPKGRRAPGAGGGERGGESGER